MSSISAVIERQVDPRSRLNSNVSELEYEVHKTPSYSKTMTKLNDFYGQVKRQLLQYQSPTSGLFPRTSMELEEAHVKDSLYCASAIWALYQAYTKRIDDDGGKAHELGQSAVKCMRGVLFAWMRQTKTHLEPFKTNQSPKHAIHSKFDLNTGLPLPDAETYGHLQIDAVSLYLIFLVQMINSGLQIIYTMDEVNFVQNLVYYVERAYRTPDFGVWERGSRSNDGTPEIHASSIGRAKSALEAINGCNLFGDKGASWSVIYVDVDAHSRNRAIFETLLPRESSSKNTDCSLVATISWPCFASHDAILYNKTKNKIVKRLRGSYGFKRFVRDGYGSVPEGSNRNRLYQPGESQVYEGLECEWPFMVCFMIIDGVFNNLDNQVKEYQEFLLRICKRETVYGDLLVPKYYYTPGEFVALERANPGSQIKVPSHEGSDYSCLFLMGQALLVVSQLLTSGLLHISELDPIRRYLPSCSRPRRSGRYSAFQRRNYGTESDQVVQVVLIAESIRLQAMMATYGIQTQTPLEVEPVQIWPPSHLVRVYEFLGVNNKLGLKGRPSRPIGALGTSKLYRINGQTVLCYPLIFEVSDFYLSYDMALLIDDIKNELEFVGKYWRMSGRPTVCILIREEHLRDTNFREMLDLLAEFKKGHLSSGLKIKTGRLQNMISSSCMEHLDFLHLLRDESLPRFDPLKQLEHTMNAGYQSLTDIPKPEVYRETIDPNFTSKYENTATWPGLIDALKNTTTLAGQSQLLSLLWKREGPHFCLPEGATVKEKLERLSRQAGGIRYWSVVRYCSSILKKLVDSISPNITSVLVNGKQIAIGSFGGPEVVIDHPLTPKEIHSLLYNTISDPYEAVLQQEVVLYLGRLINTTPHLFQGILKIRIGSILQAMRLYSQFQGEKDVKLEELSPSQIRKLMYRVFTDEGLDMVQKRHIEGALCRVPEEFYDKVWQVLRRLPGGICIQGLLLTSSAMTTTKSNQYEMDFVLLVESILAKITSPQYRQLNVELLVIIHLLLKRNPELYFPENVPIDLDHVIREAVSKFQETKNEKGMEAFYAECSGNTASYLARTVAQTMFVDSSECKIN